MNYTINDIKCYFDHEVIVDMWNHICDKYNYPMKIYPMSLREKILGNEYDIMHAMVNPEFSPYDEYFYLGEYNLYESGKLLDAIHTTINWHLVQAYLKRENFLNIYIKGLQDDNNTVIFKFDIPFSLDNMEKIFQSQHKDVLKIADHVIPFNACYYDIVIK